jgi:hypothetical protein
MTPRELLRRHGCVFHDGDNVITVPHALVISEGVKAALDSLCLHGAWSWQIAEKRTHAHRSQFDYFRAINGAQLAGLDHYAQGLLNLYRAAYGEGNA